MSFFCRSLRRTAVCLVWVISGLCSAQLAPFAGPAVVGTGNWPASVAAGVADGTGKASLVSCDPYTAGVTLACHLYQDAQGAWMAAQTYSLPGATAAKAVTVADPVLGINGVAILSVQTASPATASTFTVQFYANGTGTPQTAVANTPGGAAPVLADFKYRPAVGAEPGLLIATDSANGYFYVLTVGPNGLGSGTMAALISSVTGPVPAQAGTILPNFYPTAGTHGLRPAFGVVSTDGSSVGMVLMNPDGTWAPPSGSSRYTGSGNVYSALLADMDGDGIADLVLEGANGRIDIYHGNADGTFATASEGGTGTANGTTGDGGRLVGVEPGSLNILTATPIGMSVLTRQNGTLTYGVQGIYNIGPGRSSYALADLYGTGMLDLAVDSPEGIGIVPADANGDGGFQTSKAYSARAPALSAVVGKFRNAAANPKGNLDVVVGTGAVQAQLMEGNGDGTFNTFPGVVDTSPPNFQPLYPPPLGVWSNILSGDFDGDGNLDIFYSLTGLPQTPPSGISTDTSYVQYGNGDGTFSQSGSFLQAEVLSSNPDGVYTETAVGDFNGDGVSDFAVSNAYFDEWWLGIKSNRSTFTPGILRAIADSSGTDFNQVASGFFKVNRSSQQDLIFEQGASFVPYKNAQDGTGKNFTAMPAITGPSAPLYPSTVLLTDVDGDGNGDLVVVYYNANPNQRTANPVAPNQVDIWWGNGDGTFSQTPLVLTPNRNYYLGAVADMNGDGRPDLVLSDGSVVSILLNQGNRSFGTLLASGLYLGEQHLWAGQGINAILLADVNGDGMPDIVAANGGATLSNPLAIGGATASSIALAANPADLNTGGITVLLNGLASKPDTGALTVAPEPSDYGAAFTVTATLAPSTSSPAPTGTVQFSIDGVGVGTATLVTSAGSSTATLSVPGGNTYAVGAHDVVATYAGDASNSPVTLSTTHNVQLIPTDSQIFMCIGPTAACPAPPGVPTSTLAYTPALTMYYGQIWNGFFDAYAPDGSTLTGDVTLVDSYTGPAAAPTNPLCSLPAGLTGACPNSVGTTEGTSVGVNVLTTVYPGDATHAASTSAPIAITVLPDVTSLPTLAGAPNPSPLGQAVTFTATLTGNYAAPTGPVEFIETFPPTATVLLLGTANLVPGTGLTSTATFTTTTLPLGTDSITAGYAATQNFDAATFPTITETITPAVTGSFTLSVAPNPANVGVGASTLLTVTVTPQNGFAQGVSLACTNLPSEAACFFGANPVANGGGSTSLVVATTAPHTCGTAQPYFIGWNGGGGVALPALAGLLALLVPGRRRWLRALLAIAVVAALAQTTGCGTCTDLGTRPATYTFQVTGTASGTGEVEGVPVTVTVTI